MNENTLTRVKTNGNKRNKSTKTKIYWRQMICTRTRFSAHLSLKLICSVRMISTFLVAYTNARTHARTNATCTKTTGIQAHIFFFGKVYTRSHILGLLGWSLCIVRMRTQLHIDSIWTSRAKPWLSKVGSTICGGLYEIVSWFWHSSMALLSKVRIELNSLKIFWSY